MTTCEIRGCGETATRTQAVGVEQNGQTVGVDIQVCDLHDLSAYGIETRYLPDRVRTCLARPTIPPDGGPETSVENVVPEDATAPPPAD